MSKKWLKSFDEIVVIDNVNGTRIVGIEFNLKLNGL